MTFPGAGRHYSPSGCRRKLHAMVCSGGHGRGHRLVRHGDAGRKDRRGGQGARRREVLARVHIFTRPLRRESSTLGRVRAFFIPGKNKQIEMRRMPSAAKCNVSLTRNSCASTAGLSQPSLSLPRTAAPPQVLASNSTSVALHIVPDQNWLSMWRIALPDGRSSGMLNLTRAKDVLRSAKRFSRHS